MIHFVCLCLSCVTNKQTFSPSFHFPFHHSIRFTGNAVILSFKKEFNFQRCQKRRIDGSDVTAAVALPSRSDDVTRDIIRPRDFFFYTGARLSILKVKMQRCAKSKSVSPIFSRVNEPAVNCFKFRFVVKESEKKR